MKHYLAVIPVLVLFGCVSVPVEQNFPKAPDALLVAPPALKEVPENSQADQVFDVVIENYSSYHDVANRLRGWQQWYIEQRKIFNSIN